MGATRTKPWGYRHGTRNKFSKKHKSKGMPGIARYLPVFRRGDYVDIVVDASIQKGMPYGFYHGRTGVVFNVNRNAIGVEVTKVVGNRQLRKRLHVRLEHLRKSRCNEAFLTRVKENDQKKSDAKLLGKTINCKRVPEGPKGMKIVRAKAENIEAREVWGKREKDKEGCETAAKESLKGMGYMRGPEKTVMEYLSKNSEDYKGALFAIQKGMRLMYLHAMQSLIWNIVASKRWEKGGGDVMVGDLVVEEERDKSVKHSQRSNKKVLEVTAENISGYTMKDVVISLPGSKVVVPSVYVGLYADACREIGLLGEGVEMDMKALFSSTVKDFNLGGDYRRILGEARDMDCEVLEYAREEPKVPLVETDLMRMEGVKLPQTVKEIGEEGKGKLAGVRVSFELPASSYATIVIREITGMPQIQGYLRGLELE